MKTTKFERLSTCKEAIDYVRNQKSAILAWRNCERGDWILWIAKRLNVDDKKLTMAKAMCAKQVEHLMKDQRSKNALQACFNYVNDKITREQLNDVAAAVAAAYAADYAAYAAAYAAHAAAYGAAYAATAATVASHVATTADNDDDRNNYLRKSADICREYLTEEVLKAYKDLK